MNRPPSGKRLGYSRRLEMLDQLSMGATQAEVARAFGCSTRTVIRALALCGGMPSRRSRSRPRSPLRLSLSEREEIRAGLAAGDSFCQIAAAIGRAPSTVSREVGANGGRLGYKATAAEDRASLAARRPKPAKLAVSPRLCQEVCEMLLKRYSPQQISAKLKSDHPAEPEMQIASETIYQSLYVQSRGRLRRDLTRYLRTGRSQRKPQGKGKGRGQIRDMVSISKRPAAVEDRAVPGHWEGDLIVGKKGRSFIATLVERQTRFVMLAYLGGDSSTETVTAQIAEQIKRLPEHLRLSLTWDQGREMAGHRAFTVASGVEVYFCDPHSPWQRGSNENTNGLLRQYFPKSTDLAVHGQVELNRVAAELNERPRQTLGWKNPSEKMAELLLR